VAAAAGAEAEVVAAVAVAAVEVPVAAAAVAVAASREALLRRESTPCSLPFLILANLLASPGNTGRSSTAGGISPGGSGTQPRYGGGSYYPGGSAIPYQSGQQRRRPGGALLVPLLLVGTALVFWPAIWGAHSIYAYKYDNDDEEYTYHNATTDKEETRWVMCACDEDAVCGCGDELNKDLMKDLVGNGSYAALDKDVINVGRYEDKDYFFINATLENGTTADSNSDEAVEAMNRYDDRESAAGIAMQAYFQTLGLWPVMGSAVVAAIMMA
jgi:hypothetical protein